MTSTFFKLPDLEAVTRRLFRNPINIFNVMRTYYGTETAKKFTDLATDYIQMATNYVNAVESKEADKENQLMKWYLKADELAALMAEINQYWYYKTWQNYFYDHIKMTQAEADFMFEGKYVESIVKYDAIQTIVILIADAMAAGIIKQFDIK
jgi:hypothetical protein